ncbi:toll/interleukin-1 receptor domain-containing protein [Micropruina sonneratiae]|uniref:toll/interleukin-1 receptor domain-containing protein n=1 Tax=Micropruina sonneratiae TaxID=2986940 RepID=UPI002226487A|nr:toll/interleukin-1 receptor domain-containing protein [Micropruina sp. KQZ13P-5]MCW3158062.1 toll/interleukin-1 receptor domain-containing protein [Micropruina sp. KQZ13P-5]
MFRDDNALSTNPALWNAIEEDLSSARHLIVLLSPRAAASEYVDREVRWWLDHKGQGSVLLVLDDGELHWDAALDGFTPDSTVPSLRDGFSEEPVPVPPGLDGVPRNYLMMPDGTTLLTGYYGDTSTGARRNPRSPLSPRAGPGCRRR